MRSAPVRSLGIVLILLGFAASASASDVKVLQNLFILGADLSKIEISDLEKMLPLGADGFELPGTVSTPEDCKRIGAFIKSRHLSAGLNVAVDTLRDPSSLDPFVRAAGIKYLKSRIDCAVEIGATIMAGPIALPWGGFYDTDSTRELHDHFLDPKLEIAKISMRKVAQYAQDRGIKLALEPLHRHEMHGLNTMTEAAAFIKQVNHPNFGVCLDPSHEVIDGAGPQVYAALVRDLYDRGTFIYAQVSAPSRGDVKDSWIPWEPYFRLLKDIRLSSVTVEIMQAMPPFTGRNGCGIRLSRLPFEDPFRVVGDAIRTTREQWSKIN